MTTIVNENSKVYGTEKKLANRLMTEKWIFLLASFFTKIARVAQSMLENNAKHTPIIVLIEFGSGDSIPV